MRGFPQLRILHLSDLHFGKNHICNPPDPTGASSGIPTLAELLRRDLQSDDWRTSPWATSAEGAPDTPLIVAVTGDLTQQALPAEFDQAHECLTALAAERLLGTKVNLGDLFVVPGNHDVVFAQKKAEHRFAPYCNFYNKLFKTVQPEYRAITRPDEVLSLNQVHAFPEQSFLVAEINSSLYVEKETEDESRGQVDLESIAKLRRDLEQYQNDSKQWIKVALVHHHPVLLPFFVEAHRGYDSIVNSNSLLRLLRDHGFQLLLHGHKHFPQVFSYDPDSAWATADASIPQLVVAGGSCGSTELPEATRKCNTFNVITVKWNPGALQARVQIVTKGLRRTGPDVALDPDQWRWESLRVFDKILSPYETVPLPGPMRRVKFPSAGDDAEIARSAEYRALRFNMPVVEVMPSLEPGQGYEARVWIVRHQHHEESPVRVIWSAGPMFERKICDDNAAPDFCASFHYWGAMLIQAELEFADGKRVRAYTYARLPESTKRR